MSISELASEPRGAEFDRLPPQDVMAEQCVLGGMLLSKDAIADVVEVIKGPDFYRPAHEIVYEVILDLYGRGEPADAVTVAAELSRRSEIGRIGGAPYLHTLISSVPTAANAGYYAKIVREQAILRRLVEAGTRITQLGYAGDGDVDEVVDRAQAEIYAVTERRMSEDYQPLDSILQGTLDEIDAINSRDGTLVGVPTGIRELDDITNGLHAGQMVIVAGRPGSGKSTLALDMARSASIKHGLASVIFSLEMSRNEITMRLLSAEAKVLLHKMRAGGLTDEDWSRLARRMGEVSGAPMFIDDSPNMSMMEIRAKCRRLKQRHDLRLVIVDYLQLMTSGKRVENRQVEVSEFSRSMKLLAKELEVPVVAVSQLNRGAEQRTDKRPMLSDLRESGCLPAETRLLRADTGAEISLGELLATDSRDVPVWSLDDRLKLVPRTLTHAFSSGTKDVFRLRLTSGREISATANHPFLTYDGWRPLGELVDGSRIGVVRHVPPPLVTTKWPEAEITMLAHLIGDGSFGRHQPMRYASTDEANLQAVMDAAQHFGITPIRDECPAARVTTLRLPAHDRRARGRRDPIAAWLDELGLFGLRSHEKFIPPQVFSLPKSQVALFVRHLWATDGSVRWDAAANQARISYATTGRRLADDLARLLLRANVLCRIEAAEKPGHGDCYHVLISGAENQLRFLDEIGVHGARGELARQAAARLRQVESNTTLDTVPPEVWRDVRNILVEQQMSHRAFPAAIGTEFSGSTLSKHAASRSRLGKIAAVLDHADLEVMATNDLFWDTVVSIEPLGPREVFDATVLGTHNFVADGIAVHNSLEQDADMVILLHREEMYEKESPRAGEADLILAKHRNGPTHSGITVAFQGHYSRFVDMAHG